MDAQSPNLGNGTLRSAWSVPTRSHTCTENWNAPGACPATLPCPAVPYPASGCQPASRLQSGLVSAKRCWKRILCQPQRTGPGHNKHTRVGLGRQSSGGICPAPSTGRFPPPFHSFSTPYTLSDAFPPFLFPFYIICIVTTTHLPIQRHLRFCLQSEAFVGAGNIRLVSFPCVLFTLIFSRIFSFRSLREFENLPFRSERPSPSQTHHTPFPKAINRPSSQTLTIIQL